MNILFVDSTVKDYEIFVSSVNTNTTPVVYSPHTTRQELLASLNGPIERIAVVSHTETIIEQEYLFSDLNVELFKTIIETHQVKQIDYLACNTLGNSEWTEYFAKLPCVIGASNDDTGNIKYGGDWVMESTVEDIEAIYFSQAIQYYTYLLNFNNNSASLIINNGDLYINGNSTDYYNDNLILNTASSETFSSIASGANHNVALSAGTLYAGGLNTDRQLGDNTTSNRTNFVVMTKPTGVTSFTQASGGTTHTVALGNNKLYACGKNNSGQLGDGTTTTDTTSANKLKAMLQPTGNPDFQQVACGNDFTVALSKWSSPATGGDLYSCGLNTNSQLGRVGDATKLGPMPVPVTGLTFTQVSCGNTHTVALGNDNKLYACGNNGSGQIGDGTTTTSNTLKAMNEPTGSPSFQQVSCGTDFTVALSNGNLYSCGLNTNTQLGRDGSVAANLLGAITDVKDISNNSVTVTFTKVSCGASHVVALSSSGVLYSCGLNANGQLGDGTTTNKSRLTAMRMPAGVTFIDVSCGASHTIALASNGNYYGCGLNSSGQLGKLYTGNKFINKIISKNTASFSSGEIWIVSLSTVGVLSAAGNNTDGRLGDNTNINKNELVPMATPVNISNQEILGVSFKQVTCGGAHTVALSTWGTDETGGDLYGCGRNTNGQLGIGSVGGTHYRLKRMDSFLDRNNGTISGVKFKQVACGSTHTVALSKEGDLYACGIGIRGRLGSGSTSDISMLKRMKIPLGRNDVEITTDIKFKQVSCGRDHTVALSEAGDLYACGNNDIGRLGIGSTTDISTLKLMSLPLDINGGEITSGVKFKQVSCGGEFTVAVSEAGGYYGCGGNSNSQYGGIASTIMREGEMPTDVIFESVTCYRAFTIALSTNGKYYGRGFNGNGQLQPQSSFIGDGYSRSKMEPIPVPSISLLYSVLYNVPLTLPVTGDNITVHWGDGTFDSNTTHTYAQTAARPVAVTGSNLKLNNTNNPDRNRITRCLDLSGVSGATNLENAFDGCTQLTSVPTTIPAAITSLKDTFKGATSFNQNINTLNTSNITNITGMFDGATAFNQNVILPPGLLTIGDNAFKGTALTTVTIPSSVTTIGSSAFENSDLTTVTIPSNVATIGNSAFKGTALTTVTIPSNVDNIGNTAFANCQLTTVTIQ